MSDTFVDYAPRIPCFRYEGGVDNLRVTAALIYAIGRLGWTRQQAEGQLKCLYDHKGSLYVVREVPAPFIAPCSQIEQAFQNAWEYVGEPRENVALVNPISEQWRDVWSCRRFDVTVGPDMWPVTS